MTEWWTSLSLELQIFWAIGLIFLVITVIQLVLTLTGVVGEGFDIDVDFDVDVDTGELDQSSGIGIFSSQTISAFFMGFGWSGVVALANNLSILEAVVISFVVGVGVMYGMFYLIKSMLMLQSRGNLVYSSTIGQTGKVYVTLPGDGIDGGGQIEVMIQGRLTTAIGEKAVAGVCASGSGSENRGGSQSDYFYRRASVVRPEASSFCSLLFFNSSLITIMEIFYAAGAVVVLFFGTVVAFATRYKRCPSDKLLVVYGKVSGGKSANCYHGGAAFVWPIIQG